MNTLSLSDEEIREIAKRAAASVDTDKIAKEAVAKSKSRSKKSNTRNGILSLGLGAFITFGGIVSLDAGIGIYLLIAGLMFIGLGLFLLYLTRIV